MSPSAETTVALAIRRASRRDEILLWRWANEPSVRRASFRSDPIPWDGHRAWFAERRASSACRIYIVELDGLPAAQVRFELHGGVEAEIAVSVDPAARGRGLGTEAVRQCCARFLAETGAGSVVARVKSENSASLRLFEKAGFEDEGEETVAGCPARRLRLPAT